MASSKKSTSNAKPAKPVAAAFPPVPDTHRDPQWSIEDNVANARRIIRVVRNIESGGSGLNNDVICTLIEYLLPVADELLDRAETASMKMGGGGAS